MKNTTGSGTGATALLLAALAFAPLKAAATDTGLRVCNDTRQSQTVAIGYAAKSSWISEGWWTLEPGECATPLTKALSFRYYYLRSETGGRESTADAEYSFCTERSAFTVIGDSDCAARGLIEARFARIDTGDAALGHTVSLSTVTRPAPDGSARVTPGTYGEPYANRAIFQECESADGPAYCAFHADGTKFFVYDDGRSSQAALTVMRRLLPGDSIVVEGDLEAIHDVTADLVLREVQTVPPDRGALVLGRLQGEWYSQDDPAATFTVLGAERYDRYDGQFMGTAYLSVAPSCDRFGGDGDYIAAREEETGITDCYAIERLEDWSMELMFLPRGNFLTYRKLD